MPDSASTEFDSPAVLAAIEEFNRHNYSVAVGLLASLAELGNPRAACYLATAYELGLGVQADGQRAVGLYLAVAQKYSRKGNLSALAYNNLATIYFVGVPGVERNAEKGQEYLSRARELGFGM